MNTYRNGKWEGTKGVENDSNSFRHPEGIDRQIRKDCVGNEDEEDAKFELKEHRLLALAVP